MTLDNIEGSWELLMTHAEQFSGRQVKLVVVDSLDLSSGNTPHPSITESLQELVGTVDSGGSTLSQKTGNTFSLLMQDKYDPSAQSLYVM